MAGQVVTRAAMDALARDEYAHPSQGSQRTPKRPAKKRRKKKARQLPTSINTRLSPIQRAMIP
jgi:hypothetical protein